MPLVWGLIRVMFVLSFTHKYQGILNLITKKPAESGRDGLPSDAVLMFAPQDLQIQQYFIEQFEMTIDYKQKRVLEITGNVTICECTNVFTKKYFTLFLVKKGRTAVAARIVWIIEN